MIRSVTVTNHLGEELEMILAEPEKSGLAITNIIGLGEPDADINITEMAGTDFGSFNSSRICARNPVITIKYYGDDTEASRLKCNKYFSTKHYIKLRFITDHRDCYLSAYVEKNEPDIFSPQSGCQISLKCADKFFYSEEIVSTDFSGIQPMFHFPFSDSNAGEIQFGDIRVSKEKSINYKGEEENGVIIKLHALGIIKDFVLYNVDTSERLGINDDALISLTGYGIIENDEIIIDTRVGHKTATLIRNGVSTNIINTLNKNPRPNWFKLSAGDNLFTYTASQGEYDVVLNIEHNILYKGI
jgi:hypothetical protein